MLWNPQVTFDEPDKQNTKPKPKWAFTRQMTRFEFRIEKQNWMQKWAEKLEIREERWIKHRLKVKVHNLLVNHHAENQPNKENDVHK